MIEQKVQALEKDVAELKRTQQTFNVKILSSVDTFTKEVKRSQTNQNRKIDKLAKFHKEHQEDFYTYRKDQRDDIRAIKSSIMGMVDMLLSNVSQAKELNANLVRIVEKTNRNEVDIKEQKKEIIAQRTDMLVVNKLNFLVTRIIPTAVIVIIGFSVWQLPIFKILEIIRETAGG